MATLHIKNIKMFSLPKTSNHDFSIKVRVTVQLAWLQKFFKEYMFEFYFLCSELEFILRNSSATILAHG